MTKEGLVELRVYVSPAEAETIRALAEKVGVSAWFKALAIEAAKAHGVEWPGETIGRGKYERPRYHFHLDDSATYTIEEVEVWRESQHMGNVKVAVYASDEAWKDDWQQWARLGEFVSQEAEL